MAAPDYGHPAALRDDLVLDQREVDGGPAEGGEAQPPDEPEQREGRNTWYFWTGGNQKFWVKMAELTEGNVNLLAYVDSRLHGRRLC